MKEQIGSHSLWTLPLLGSVHSDTILTTWLAMIIALLLLSYVGRSYRAPRAGKTQTLFEGIIDYIADMVNGSLGRGGEPFVPFFIALFIFIFLLNQFGVFPFKALGLPFGGSPTADLNTTVPYALIVFFMIWTVAIRKKGIGAFAHLFKPLALAPINILEELVRPVTLAARLFFNIFVGELLFVIIASIVNAKVSVGPVNLSVAVSILPFFIQFFNFFVGTVQAFVFTLLGIVYLSLATAEDH
ncbi:MAG: F0F1 ATP synthase subunit A [Candidatus Eremiobacteraeota bacterium]|nr:F0F1 ATP synthase subunit A [Candidatus Eremiobacteraeota bacterium]